MSRAIEGRLIFDDLAHGAADAAVTYGYEPVGERWSGQTEPAVK